MNTGELNNKNVYVVVGEYSCKYLRAFTDELLAYRWAQKYGKDCVEFSDERAIVIRECDDKKSVLFGDKEVEE